MSWGLEQLAALRASAEQRRGPPTRNNSSPSQNPFIVTSPRVSGARVTPEAGQRSQPSEVISRTAPPDTPRSTAAGSLSADRNEQVEQGDDLATPRAAARTLANSNSRAPATGQSQAEGQDDMDTPRAVPWPSTTNGTHARVRRNLVSTENHAPVTPEAAISSSVSGRASVPARVRETATQSTAIQSQTYLPHAIQYPSTYQAPTEDQNQVTQLPFHNQYEYPAQYPSQLHDDIYYQPHVYDSYPAFAGTYSGQYVGNWFDGRSYNYNDSQYLSGADYGNGWNQRVYGTHAVYESYGTQGSTRNSRNGLSRRNWNRRTHRGRGGNSSCWWGNNFGGVSRGHSRPLNEAMAPQFRGPTSHNFQYQNQVSNEQPYYNPHLYFEVSGLESSYMPPQAPQQGFGNPEFYPPAMSDEASLRNTYGFPLPMPQMPASTNMQMPMQMPPPGGHNTIQTDPIPRPQTQFYNPFPHPPVTSGAPYGPPPPLGPQPGYHPHPNGPPSSMPPLAGASGAPQEAMTLDMVTHHSAMPFENGPLNHRPDQWGVAKIKNIPYAITKQEIGHFMGRNSKMITPDLGCPIHIIMERSTSKTMDCYVEFMTQGDAEAAVARINRTYENGRIPRLGSRHVDVEVSSQDELLKDLFPRAKQIVWKNGVPHLGPNDDPYSTGFQGFFTHEEIFLLIRHAENPQRSPFITKCLWRAYECTISTLKKFPWFATNMYSVEDRNQLFTVTLRHVNALVPKIEKDKIVGLDRKLLGELLDAGLKCPGFNERQKFALVMASKVSTEYHRLSAVARYWPFDTLCMKANTSNATMMYYANLIQKGLSVKDPSTQTLANSYRPQYQGESPFGRIWLEWGFNNTYHKFQAAVEYELQMVRSLVLEGYTANPTANPVVLPQQQQQQHGQGQDQNQGGGNSGSQPAPPSSAPQQHNYNNAPFSGASSPFFPPGGSTQIASSGPLPTQMSTIPPGSMPIVHHGPGIAGPRANQGFNMPLPQLQQPHQAPNTPATTGPARSTSANSNANANVGGGNGGSRRGGGSNNRTQNQNQNQNQGQGQGQRQGNHGSNHHHRSNRHQNHQGRNNQTNNDNNNFSNSQARRR